MADPQGEVYAQFVASQLENERKRRETLDSRATGTMATSAAFVGLIAAVGLFAPSTLLAHPGALRRAFLTAAVLTTLSALLALWAGWLHRYDVLEAGDVRRLLIDDWADTPVTARGKVAQFNARTLATLRKGNDAKAIKLAIAHVLQLVGLLLLLVVGLVAAVRSMVG
jgi:hypothetical protein